MVDRYGAEALPLHFRAFDTICSATQDRQDAVVALLGEQQLDLMVVVGGYNSSNTRNLARICAERLPTFHVADAGCLESPDRVRHRGMSTHTAAGEAAEELVTEGWLPAQGPVVVGLTAGASTPNNIIGQVVEKLSQFASTP
jgi:4-hydroxy-3-methylbut-2-enyl diphosphate reductase